MSALPQKTLAQLAIENRGKTQPVHPPVVAPKKHNEPDVVLWQKAKHENAEVRVVLLDGNEVRGLVRAFGLYTVLVEVAGRGAVLLFKNAMAWAEIPR